MLPVQEGGAMTARKPAKPNRCPSISGHNQCTLDEGHDENHNAMSGLFNPKARWLVASESPDPMIDAHDEAAKRVMARPCHCDLYGKPHGCATVDSVANALRKAAADEREACAVAVSEYAALHRDYTATQLRDAIRARAKGGA